MKKLLTLLSIPLIFVSSCGVPNEPVKENYFTGSAPLDMLGRKVNVLDFDKDGFADAILYDKSEGAGNFAMFYVKGYEKQANVIKTSIEMTPELREDASNFIRADNSLRYHAAKLEYEKNISKYDSTEVKK